MNIKYKKNPLKYNISGFQPKLSLKQYYNLREKFIIPRE